MITYHICENLEKLEERLGFVRHWFRDEYCVKMYGKPYWVVYNGIQEYKRRGYIVKPRLDCNNIQPNGKCGGHES